MIKRIVIFASIVVVLIVAYFLVTSYSVKFLKAKIQQTLGPGVSVSQIRATTRYVAITKIEIKDPQTKLKILNVNELRIYPALRTLLHPKKIIIQNVWLDSPSIFIYRTPDSVFIGPWPRKKETKTPQKGKPSYEVTIDRISINNGICTFTDHKKKIPPAVIKLVNLQSEIDGIQYPINDSAKIPIKLLAKLTNENGGPMGLKGWINFNNFDSQFNFSLTNANVRTFEPYYKEAIGNFVNEGYSTITSSIEINSFNLNVDGHVHLFKLLINKNGESKIHIPAETIAKVLEEKGNEVDADFHTNGNLKDPNYKPASEIEKSVIENISKSTGISIKKKAEDYAKEKAEKGIDKLKKFFKKDKK